MPRKMNPDGRAYRRALLDVALSYCPPIRPCPDCGYPQVQGYLCWQCPEPKIEHFRTRAERVRVPRRHAS